MTHILRITFINVLLLTAISGLNAQSLNSKLYTAANGLLNDEIGLFFTCYDSTSYFIEADNTITRFDGYRFRKVNTEVKICKSGAIAGYNFKDYTVITSMCGTFLYSKGKFEALSQPTEIASNIGLTLTKEGFKAFQNNELWHVDIKNKRWIRDSKQPTWQKQVQKPGSLQSISYDGKKCIVGYPDRFEVRDFIDGRILPNADIPDLSGIPAKLLTKSTISKLIDLYYYHVTLNNPKASQIFYLESQVYKYFGDSIKHITSLNQNNSIATTEVENKIVGASHNGLRIITKHITFFAEKTAVPEALHTIVELSGTIIFGGYGSGVKTYDERDMKYIPGYNNQSIMPGGTSDTKNRAFLIGDGSFNGIYELQKEKETIKLNKILPNTGYISRILSDSSLAIGSLNNEVFIGKKTSGKWYFRKYGKEDSIKSANTLGIAEDRIGRVWMMGSSVALLDRKINKITSYTKNASRGFSGFTMCSDNRGGIWFGPTSGIYHLRDAHNFSTKDSLFTHSSMRKIELPNDEVAFCTFSTQVDSYMVIGTTKSVNFIDLDSYYKNPSNPKIYQLLYGDDLEGGGSEQNAVFFDSKRRLWIGCSNGALMIDWDKYKFDETTSKIIFTHLEAGGDTLYNYDEFIKIPSDKRNIKLSFGLDKNISLNKNVFFDYYLLTSNGDTLISKRYDQEGELELPYLGSGEYELVIEARKHGLVMDRITRRIQVATLLSENKWFWAGIVGISFLVLGISWYQHLQHKSEILKNELQLNKLAVETNLLKTQTLVSSLNPHFLYNCLNWIQSKYIHDEESVVLIGKLSDNLKYILLKSSEKEMVHSLKSEIDLVENYISIQMIRFKDRFTYSPPKLDLLEKYKDLPFIIMALQIHVENAIEHGIRHRKDSSKVSIEIKEVNSNLEIIITDDGIGRNKAKDLSTDGTKKGTVIVNDLMHIYNASMIHEISHYYEDDIYQSSKGSYGTRSIFVIKVASKN